VAGGESVKIVEYLESSLSQAITNMAAKHIPVAHDLAAPEPGSANAIIWQQPFSAPDGPSLWIVAGKEVWEAVGKLTLEAAGIDDASEEDCRSTWQELVNQTASGIATALTAVQSREVTASKGAAIEAEPAGLSWQVFSITVGETSLAFKAAWTKELAELGEPAKEETPEPPVVREAGVSRTFDLLLDVALPISVSFGKTSLQIREVLKLNTGSIVELDRFVTDPVEVIVNDCVIARGEVVVVDGNYGVRVSQLASREERLRTGIAEAAHKGGRA
jgi:flagellar motor switch protein FliN/FliY